MYSSGSPDLRELVDVTCRPSCDGSSREREAEIVYERVAQKSKAFLSAIDYCVFVRVQRQTYFGNEAFDFLERAFRLAPDYDTG